MRIRRDAGLTWNRILMRVDNSTGTYTSDMETFVSVVDRMNMKLGSKFLSSLRVKTQLLERLQCVIVVDGATHSQKDGVEDDGGSLMDGAEVKGSRGSSYVYGCIWCMCKSGQPYKCGLHGMVESTRHFFEKLFMSSTLISNQTIQICNWISSITLAACSLNLQTLADITEIYRHLQTNQLCAWESPGTHNLTSQTNIHKQTSCAL